MLVIQLIGVIIAVFLVTLLFLIPIMLMWWKLKFKKMRKIVRREMENEEEEERRIRELPDIQRRDGGSKLFTRTDERIENRDVEAENEEGVGEQRRVPISDTISVRKDKREPITFG